MCTLFWCVWGLLPHAYVISDWEMTWICEILCEVLLGWGEILSQRETAILVCNRHVKLNFFWGKAQNDSGPSLIHLPLSSSLTCFYITLVVTLQLVFMVFFK